MERGFSIIGKRVIDDKLDRRLMNRRNPVIMRKAVSQTACC